MFGRHRTVHLTTIALDVNVSSLKESSGWPTCFRKAEGSNQQPVRAPTRSPSVGGARAPAPPLSRIHPLSCVRLLSLPNARLIGRSGITQQRRAAEDDAGPPRLCVSRAAAGAYAPQPRGARGAWGAPR